MFSAHDPSDIDRFFRGLTEYAFHARLGVVDPPLVDYVSVLLVRFLRNEAALPSAVASEAADVARLLVEAASHTGPDDAREKYRRIGDVTLFWSGLYPESLRRFEQRELRDPLEAYRETGKRAYWLASTLEPANAADERRLLERLSSDYDLCIRPPPQPAPHHAHGRHPLSHRSRSGLLEGTASRIPSGSPKRKCGEYAHHFTAAAAPATADRSRHAPLRCRPVRPRQSHRQACPAWDRA